MSREVDRRTVIAGAGVVAATAALAATQSKHAAAAPPPVGQFAPPGTVVAKTSDVPVGGGIILGELLITQPTPGVFLGFCSHCTHLGCVFGSVANGTVNCFCHGSKFNLDGSVARGPAFIPMIPRPIRVEGDNIVTVLG